MKNRKLVVRYLEVELRQALETRDIPESYIEYFVNRYIESKYTNHKTWFQDQFYEIFDNEFQEIKDTL